jgi:hypothetical protein
MNKNSLADILARSFDYLHSIIVVAKPLYTLSI